MLTLFIDVVFLVFVDDLDLLLGQLLLVLLTLLFALVILLGDLVLTELLLVLRLDLRHSLVAAVEQVVDGDEDLPEVEVLVRGRLVRVLHLRLEVLLLLLEFLSEVGRREREGERGLVIAERARKTVLCGKYGSE